MDAKFTSFRKIGEGLGLLISLYSVSNFRINSPKMGKSAEFIWGAKLAGANTIPLQRRVRLFTKLEKRER